MKKTLVAVTVALALTLSGCVSPINTGLNKAAIEELKNNPLDGFTLNGTREPTCGIDYCSANYGYDFTSNNTDDQATFCKKLIAWGTKYGVDSWLTDPNYVAMPLKGHESIAQMMCVGGMNYSLVGSTGNVRWWIQGSPQRLQIETIMNTEGGIDDNRMILRTSDDAKKELFVDTQTDMDLLSAIETYRVDHPNEDPLSEATIKKAIANLNIKVTIKKDKKNKARYLDIPAGDVMLERCVNITPYDETYFQAPNPKSGFFTLYLPEETKTIDQFGYTISGACP